jgi:AcrR family transcriptional regulator
VTERPSPGGASSPSSPRPLPEAPQPRPLRRGEHARRRVLSAALEVLAESGMPGFTIESVARRAGASKATLYRHWPSASALLVDAMDAEFRPLPDVASGDVRADMINVLTAVAAMLDRPPFPELMAAFIDAAERDPALAGLQASLTQRRREPLLRVVIEAKRLGALPEELDPDLVVDLLAAPFFYRRFVAHRPIPVDLPTLVVDHVLTALRQDRRDHHPPDCDGESGDRIVTPS